MTRHPARTASARLVPILILPFLALLFLALPISAAAAPPSDQELAAYADQVFSKMYPADEPGAAVLVQRDGRVVLRKGYGIADLELGVPIQPDMVFELGSVTKQFTAAAVLKLAEQGKLRLEDEVTKHLPDYPTHGARITIEHLLTHTSGIPSYTGLPEWQPLVRKDLTLPELIALFKDKPLEFAPGEKWSYNNSAYVLLGAVIEKVSGRSYEDFVEQEVFAPLGMTRSRYGHQEELVPGRVEGYHPQGDGGYVPAPYLSMTQPYAAGSLMSTVDDLARWDEGLAPGKLLSAASLERMFTAVRLNSGFSTRYGGGWFFFEHAGRRFIEHGGDIFGFTALITRVPEEKLLVVVLSNNPPKRPDAPVLQVAAYALGEPLEERKTIEVADADLEGLVGVYRFDESTARAITREGTKVFAQRTGSEKLEILPVAPDVFVYPSGGELRFRRDGQGRVAAVRFLPRSGPEAEGRKTDEPIPAERQAIQLDPAVLDRYVGIYELGPGFDLAVVRDGERIFAHPTGQPKAELFPASETEFFLRVVDAKLVFQTGPDGRATGLVLHQGGREMPAKRKE
jgi:D-alanyl-D-alanine carboxypeptidase